MSDGEDYVPQPERVGSDESGKGDYFGPLVVAACYVNPQSEAALDALGVIDSKKVSNKRTLALAREIRRICPVEVIAIGPERYNQLYAKMQNLNKLMGWAHGKAIKNLLERFPGASQVVSDKFGAEEHIESQLRGVGEVELVQIPRGERDRAVAAASLVARAEFLRRMERLGDQVGILLPRGATDVLGAARQVFARDGEAGLARVAKLHFKTTKKVRSR